MYRSFKGREVQGVGDKHFDLTAAAKAMKKEIGWTGGPIQLFEKVGRDSFDTALALGLSPHHKFLDFGAGMLRLGYWFVRYLDSGNYYAIEPRAEAMEAGKKHLLGGGAFFAIKLLFFT